MTSEGNLVLADGRHLSYAQFGVPDGYPVFYFHGAPSSRLEPLLLGDDIIARAGLCLIAPDRPGMGRSDFQHHRGFSHWPADVIALADALNIERFSVLGNSGGAGYAAACAALIPERLNAAVIVSGSWQMNVPDGAPALPFVNRLVWFFAQHAPPVLGLMLKGMSAASGANRDKELLELKRRVPAADFEAFELPGRLEAFSDTLRESLRQGTRGPTWDMGLYVKPFDFSLQSVQTPMRLFHGALDANVPIGLVRRIVGELPGASLTTYDHDAHLSTLCEHFDDIAGALRH